MMRFISELRFVFVASILSLLLTSIGAFAHEVRPALLDIRENGDGWFDVTLKVPVLDGKISDITPVFSKDFVRLGNTVVREGPASIIESSKYKSENETLVGLAIEIAGLSSLQIDVLVQISMANGTSYSTILKPNAPRYIVPEEESNWAVASGYALMGISHILSGYDHLAFVLALILLVGNRWTLVKAITAFTVAHSISLALATLGFVNVPPKPTEAVIALSIVFLALEVLRKYNGQNGGLAERAPWIVAFGFGLIHGLGFAGALSDVGLPDHAIPLALFAFNVGVEVGQLMFVAVVLVIIFGLRRLNLNKGVFDPRVAPYAIGCLGAYWVIDRILGFAVLAS